VIRIQFGVGAPSLQHSPSLSRGSKQQQRVKKKKRPSAALLDCVRSPAGVTELAQKSPTKVTASLKVETQDHLFVFSYTELRETT
jgi:hypothetical protein